MFLRSIISWCYYSVKFLLNMCHTQGDIFMEQKKTIKNQNWIFFLNAFGGKHRYKGEIEDLWAQESQLEPISYEDVVGWSIFLFSCVCFPSVFWACVVHFPCLCRLGVSSLNSLTSPTWFLIKACFIYCISSLCSKLGRQLMCSKTGPVSRFLTTIWLLLPGSPAMLCFA